MLHLWFLVQIYKNILKSKDETKVITQGKELVDVPKEIKDNLDGKEGYKSLGQVYKDPKTGKLILISE